MANQWRISCDRPIEPLIDSFRFIIVWQAVTRFAILDGAAVISADKQQPYSAALSVVLAIASWATLFWTSPAAFASGLVFGLGAVLLGLNGYTSTVRISGRFRPIF